MDSGGPPALSEKRFERAAFFLQASTETLPLNSEKTLASGQKNSTTERRDQYVFGRF
jgi:hypothetical protein